jgi:hypothetical protein
VNKFKEKNQQVSNNPLNQFTDKLDLGEPKLLPISWLSSIFGCRHKKMGIPFTRGQQTYCTCMLCGASQKFDVKLWKNIGPFYYNPVLELYSSPTEKTYKTSQLVSSPEFNKGTEDGGQNFQLSENKDKDQE